MSLSSIANDIKSSVEQGSAWLAKAVEEHVPALLTEAEKIQASPIFQLLEGIVLPPEVEAEIANVVKAMLTLAKAVSAPVVPVAVAEPEAPAEPVLVFGEPVAPVEPEAPAEPAAV